MRFRDDLKPPYVIWVEMENGFGGYYRKVRGSAEKIGLYRSSWTAFRSRRACIAMARKIEAGYAGVKQVQVFSL